TGGVAPCGAVDRPPPRGAHPLPAPAAALVRFPPEGARLEGLRGLRIGDADTKRAEARRDAGSRRLAERAPVGECRGVALHVLAGEPAEELVDRPAQGLAADVPEREVERAEGGERLPAGRRGMAPGHELPERPD